MDNLKYENNLMEMILSCTQEAIAIVSCGEDGTFRYKYVNKSFEQSMLIEENEILNKTPEEIFGNKIGNELTNKYYECIESKKTIEFEE